MARAYFKLNGPKHENVKLQQDKLRLIEQACITIYLKKDAIFIQWLFILRNRIKVFAVTMHEMAFSTSAVLAVGSVSFITADIACKSCSSTFRH